MVGCHAAQSAPGAFPSLWPIPSDADVLVVCTLSYSLIGCRRGIVRVTLLLPGLVAGVPRTGSVGVMETGLAGSGGAFPYLC